MQKPLDRGFRLEGTFSLPRLPFNGGWYAEWITYTEKPTQQDPFPPFVQVGLIRTRETDLAVQPFVAQLRRGERRALLRTFATIANGPHRLGFQATGGTLAFDVDGAAKYSVATRDVTAPGANAPYLQIGYELSAPDDRAQGSIRALALSYGSKRDLLALDTAGLSCTFSSNGISWQTEPAALVATGKFDAAMPDVGRCKP